MLHLRHPNRWGDAQHDGTARRWLLRRWEGVPSLKQTSQQMTHPV